MPALDNRMRRSIIRQMAIFSGRPDPGIEWVNEAPVWVQVQRTTP